MSDQKEIDWPGKKEALARNIPVLETEIKQVENVRSDVDSVSIPWSDDVFRPDNQKRKREALTELDKAIRFGKSQLEDLRSLESSVKVFEDIYLKIILWRENIRDVLPTFSIAAITLDDPSRNLQYRRITNYVLLGIFITITVLSKGQVAGAFMITAILGILIEAILLPIAADERMKYFNKAKKFATDYYNEFSKRQKDIDKDKKNITEFFDALKNGFVVAELYKEDELDTYEKIQKAVIDAQNTSINWVNAVRIINNKIRIISGSNSDNVDMSFVKTIVRSKALDIVILDADENSDYIDSNGDLTVKGNEYLEKVYETLFISYYTERGDSVDQISKRLNLDSDTVVKLKIRYLMMSLDKTPKEIADILKIDEKKVMEVTDKIKPFKEYSLAA